MADIITGEQVLKGIASASAALAARKEEVNRLNVFPVPDGDTGTNMSLTLQSVVDNIQSLGLDAKCSDRCKAITTGALMGARGNSGVITSQILRGLCEAGDDVEEYDVSDVNKAFAHAVEVAFKAVRKPVKGTILTVLEDAAAAAKFADKKKMSLEEALDHIVAEAYASVERTPEFLPVLKENGVVDAGGFGLSILIDSFAAYVLGKDTTSGADNIVAAHAAPKVEIEHINDWEGSKYRYCNEFLVHSETLDISEALDFLATMGDCELCVGATPKFKVHVHSNTPDRVLKYFLDRGQIFEVFIHNMQLQSEERNDKLAAEQNKPRKPLGVVAVAAGSGNAEILEGLGVDVVVSGGQTMNPSTKDLLDAAKSCNADAVIILPDNSNIIMAAQSAAELADFPVGVVPTKSVPAAFSALFALDASASLQDNVDSMSEVLPGVHVGEVTTAIKDSKDAHDNPIHNGDVIGIADGSIEAVGHSLEDVVLSMLDTMGADDYDTLTILAGEDYDDDALDALVERVESAYEDLEIDPHRGEQPLYPIIFSLE